MLTTSGRPRKACSTCKAQKIRCSGERPTCKRCSRLKHTCIYNNAPNARSVRPARATPQTPTSLLLDSGSFPTPTAPRSAKHITSNRATQYGNRPSSIPALLKSPSEETYLGIPKSLVSTLVEAWYDNVYNAHLLLHKRMFLESLEKGTARTHVVLSVCAWGANFFRDENGQAALKDYGFMIEWAKRAGSLVFQEAEDLHEDNIVTFCNLALFWHSQGSWRIAYLHKGNACNLLQIMGLRTMRTENSLESEIQRRRFWACYLMHCQNSERLMLFEPVADILNLTLPWPEEEFECGISTHTRVSLESVQSNGGIFSEIIKVITLWSSVLALIKAREVSLAERIASIHELDEKLSQWWRNLRPDFKLTSSTITAMPPKSLPRIMLINIVYHQALCALHASIVPLFCWAPGNDSWSSARQLSAQVAFEHAGAASTLMDVVLSSFSKLSAMPGFVAYAAYCGCAIQIPFMWCIDPAVKERAKANVRANVKMIHTMANYWKFSALLKIHVRCLYNIHRKRQTVLENEPKYINDIRTLTSFENNVPNAQALILEYTGILQSKRDGWARPGEEKALQIEEGENECDSRALLSDNHEDPTPTQSNSQSPAHSTYPYSYTPVLAQRTEDGQYHHEEPHQHQTDLPSPVSLHQPDLSGESQILDSFNPFFDPEMLDFIPNGDIPDLSQLETNPLNLDYFEIEGWETAPAISIGQREGQSITRRLIPRTTATLAGAYDMG